MVSNKNLESNSNDEKGQILKDKNISKANKETDNINDILKSESPEKKEVMIKYKTIQATIPIDAQSNIKPRYKRTKLVWIIPLVLSCLAGFYVYCVRKVDLLNGSKGIVITAWYKNRKIKEEWANEKRKGIIAAINFVTTDLNKFENNSDINEIKDINKELFDIDAIGSKRCLKNKYRDILLRNSFEGGFLGATSTSMTIYDIYNVCDNHEEVLNVLEYRFNREMGNASPLDWFRKSDELFYKGNKSVSGYMSGYTGQAGEYSTIKFFENQGLKAELFPSRTHPDNDCRVYYEDGTHIDYSVKSYEDMSDFNKAVSAHPESSHYVVNKELYSMLEESGKVEEYQNRGIMILNGGFSNYDNREIAEETLHNIDDAGDLADDIPGAAFALFGYKFAKNGCQLLKGKQSAHEFAVNTAIDGVRVGTGGISAIAGAKLGAAIGTGFGPGVGTIIGGGIGAVAGYVGGSAAFNWLKEKFKWGEIIKAIDYLGHKYRRGFTYEMAENIKRRILGRNEIAGKLSIEERLLLKYKEQLNPYKKDKITLPAILCYLNYNNLKVLIHKIDKSVLKLEDKIYKLCDKVAKDISNKRSEDKKTLKKRLLGEIIAANSDVLLADSRDYEMVELISKYKKQIKKSPNHPYRFSHDSEDILKGMAIKAMIEYPAKDLIERKLKLIT